PGQNQAPHNLPSVTVKPADVVLTIMAEPTKETESSSTQQGAISQLGGPLIEAEPSLGEQEQLPQPSQSYEEVALSPAEQEAITQLPSFPVEAEPSSTEEQQQAQPSESLGEVEPSSEQQEASAQSPEYPEPIVLPPSHNQAQHLILPSVTGKPADLQLTITQPTIEVGTSSVHHEVTTLPSVPDNVEKPSETQQETPILPPEPPKTEYVEYLPIQQKPPAQILESLNNQKPFPIQQQAMAEQAQTPEEVESSVTQQEAPTQAPASSMEYIDNSWLNDEVTFPSQHFMLPYTTVHHVDLGLTLTPEPTTEVKSSVQQENPPISTGQAGFFLTQSNLFPQPLKHPIMVESFQQEATAQTSDPPKEVESSPDLLETPGVPSELPKEVEPAPAYQVTPSQPPE
ncbi:leucine-rich repeat-containing protein 37A2-like, partial [Tupaia chinensis]|uniref:leucine-rich repeat-containing protein 37A2-like n=1 Tax=Tupaia chinensis TaxID=246437 RepID=UPI00070427B6